MIVSANSAIYLFIFFFLQLWEVIVLFTIIFSGLRFIRNKWAKVSVLVFIFWRKNKHTNCPVLFNCSLHNIVWFYDILSFFPVEITLLQCYPINQEEINSIFSTCKVVSRSLELYGDFLFIHWHYFGWMRMRRGTPIPSTLSFISYLTKVDILVQ